MFFGLEPKKIIADKLNWLDMKERLTIIEQKNQRKGRNYSIAIHVIILLLLFIFGRFADNPEESIDDQYAVAIDFTLDRSSNSTSGQEAAGEMPEQAAEEERAEEVEEQPEEVEEVVEEVEEIVEEEEFEDEPVQEVTEIITPEVTEVVEEESPVTAVEDEIAFEEPVKVDIPKKQDVPKPSTGASKPKTSTSKPSSSSGSGTGSNNTTSKPSSGSGTGKTDSGSGSGSDASGNDGNSGIGTGGLGKGEYDDSGQGIFGRRVIKIPNLGSLMQNDVTGKIVVKMCVNPRGDVIHTELIRKETSITNRAKLKRALEVAKNYKYEKDIDAPREQCGKFTFKLDINK